MKENIIKISSSSVKSFSQCPKKYYYSYVEKLPKKEWDHFILGNLCHKSLEIFHKSYKDKPVPTKSFAKLMGQAFKEACKEAEISGPIKDEAFELLKEYLETITAKSMPNVIGVETPFEFNLNDNIVIRGVIDRLDLVEENKYRVIDYKTTKNTKYLDSFQLAIYGLWLIKEYPSIKEYDASYVLLRHKSTEKSYTFNLRDLDKTKKDLINYAQKIDAETTWPMIPSPLCKYCDFKETCPSQKAW